MNRQHKYSLGSKLGYASGDILGGGSFALLSLLFLNYLVTIEGMNAGLAGAIVMAGKVWDAVTDPVMGVISDRTHTRFGRRRVYLLLGALPVLIVFSLLWYSFGITGTIGKFVYYVVMYLLFSTAFTIVMVPYNALLPDMVDSYTDRAGYTTIRMFVSNLAAAVSVVLPPVLLGPEACRTRSGYLRMAFVFACFYALPLVITFLSTWENPVRQTGTSPSFGAMARQFKNSFRNRAYRQYLGIFTFGQAATDAGTTITVFWLTDVLRRPNLLMLVTAVTMAAGICILPFNNRVAKKYGKHYPAFICGPFRGLGLIIAFFMGPQSGPWLLVLVSVLNGIGAGASSFVPWTLLPDLPDSDEMITGQRNAGIYAGISTFVRKSTSGIGIFITGILLGAFGYTESTAGEIVTQTPAALMGVRIMFTVIPLILSLLTIRLGWRYTLTKKNHAAVRAAVDYRRGNGRPTEDRDVRKACEQVSGLPFSTVWAGKDDG
jgi:oligogalacturonide transporter